MNAGWKRLLSLLLTAAMVLSLGAVGYATDDGEIAIIDPEETVRPDPGAEGTPLDLEYLDPDTLGVHKLGEETEETDGISLIDTEDGISAREPDPDEIVRVSIFLDEAATLDAGYPMRGVGTNSSAIAYRDSLRAKQDALTAQIESEIGYTLDVRWNLTLAVNAISAYVRVGDIPLIGKMPGVRSVIRENQYQACEGDAAQPNTANTSSNMVGATAAWAAGYTGAGSRVAIIDTGVDTTHQSFNEDAFLHAIEEVRASGKTVNLMTSIPSSGLNARNPKSFSAKIPYGYNYVDQSQTIDHMSDTQGEHGSHVAGIATANRYIKSGSSYLDAADTVGAVGMAPDAQLLVMKVFGAGGGAYDSDYMAAIEDAIVLDCDSVNLSLGSGVQGWTYSEYQDVMNRLSSADNEGMVVSISAGNAYDLAYMMESRNLYRGDIGFHTGGSPGTFLNSLCVAAAQNTLTTGTPMEFNGSQKVYYYESTEDSDGNTYTNPKLTTITGRYDYVYIDAIGEASDYSTVNGAVSLSGKIVIVNRGETSFSEKGNNAKSYSPKAVIVANNQDGTIYMNLSDYTGTFPMVTITLKDVNLIKEGSTEHTVNGITYYTGTVTVTDVEQSTVIDRSEATVTEFSSWGVPGSLIMKPEITAPGGDIYSVAGTNKTSGGATAGGSDQYEYMSGTSMAAPHITGLAAVVAQYLRDNDLSAANSALTNSYSTRAIIQSLLMSTATPMKPEGQYLPVLQQGAGLAEVNKAVSAASVLMMDEAGLTTLTGAAADGKVKVELGEDAFRSGSYSYSFTLYNITDTDLVFTLDTELFTQATDGVYTLRGTMNLPGGGVSYSWNGEAPAPSDGHDVNMNGVTDENDAQAILDYVSGLIEEADIDPAAADMDGDEVVTSYDAYLLLNWEGEGETPATGYVLAANGTAQVTVTINLTAAQKSFLEEAFPDTGAYIEGYTYVTCVNSTREGVSLAHQHSIPILGYYGKWTDASMFDAASYVGGLYGDGKVSYTRNQDTNYLRVMYNGTTVKFSGNPYMVEDEFPADRLAINSRSTIVSIAYNLYRASAATGFAVTVIDEEGQNTAIKTATVTGNYVNGIYYVQSSGSWQNLTMKTYGVNKSASEFGLAEGDRFRIGYYAIPEYYGMILNDTWTQEDSADIDVNDFRTLLTDNMLGKGAFIGYDFVIDDTDPVIDRAELSNGSITVHATDDRNLAYVAVLSLDGTVKYAEKAPGCSEYSISFDAADAIAYANGYVAVFAGDYAGNEAAVAIKVNDNTHVEKTVYVQTSTLTAGNDYLIVNTTATGTGYSLYYTLNSSGSTATAGANAVAIKPGTSDTGNKPYIESADAASTAIWTAGTGTTNGTYTFGNNGWYLRRSNSNALTITKDTSRRDWTWDSANNRLAINSRYYLRYYNNTFSINTATNSVYLYEKTVISYEVDPFGVTGITVTPTSLELYKGSSADLTAKVTPITAQDRTVTWSSSDSSIATVDQYGHVNALAAGTVTITATANGNTSMSASCTLTVVSVNKNLNAIVWDEEGDVFFSSFNASSLPAWSKLHNSGAGVELLNAYMADASTLYAATCDISDTSVIYTVNRSTYALTEFGVNYVPAFGMARASTRYTDYFVYGFAKYLIFGNLTPVTEEDLGTYSGLPYGLLDLSTTSVGDAYVAAVCPRNVGTTSSGFYFLDETGKIWQTTMSIGSSVSFGTPTLVVDTGIGASFMYQSLYYDGTYLYWAHLADDTSELIIINPNTKSVFHAGDFGENVWPVAGLYVNGSAAPASVDEEEPMTLDLRPVATREELLTYDVCMRLGIPYTGTVPADPDFEIIDMEEPEDDTEIIDILPNGMLNVFRGTTALLGTSSDSETDEDGVVLLTIREDTPSTNGYISVSYDPDVLSLDKERTLSSLSFHSFYLDEDKGLISFTYANRDELPADTVLAEICFTGAPCEDTEVVVETWEHNEQVELSEDEEVAVEGTGHEWGEPTYTWSDDNSEVTAERVCAHNNRHIESETVPTTSEVTTEPSYSAPGVRTYTASFENPAFETQTKEVEIPKLEGDFVDVYVIDDNNGASMNLYVWNDSTNENTAAWPGTAMERLGLDMNGHPYYKMTVDKALYDRVIVNNGSQQTVNLKFIEDANGRGYVIYEIPANFSGLDLPDDIFPDDAAHKTVTDPTCTEAGVITWKGLLTEATVETEGDPATGHDWEFVDFSWTETEDGYTAVANYKCKNDETHTTTADATVTPVTTDATCEEAGQTVYTATVAADASPDEEEHSEEKTVEIAALGHDWEFVDFTWTETEDGYTAVANYVCKNDETHTDTVEATVTFETTLEPDCDTAGQKVYTATVTEDKSLDEKEHSEDKTVEIAALGHDWTFVDFSWTETEDGYEVVANYICSVCGETDTVTATVETETLSDPTCTEEGTVRYHAYVTEESSLDGEYHEDEREGKLDKLDHVWIFSDVTWDGNIIDGFTATANYHCDNCNAVDSREMTVTSVTTEPTCSSGGKIVYTAYISADDSLDGEEHSEEHEEILVSAGHDWEFVDFSWTETEDGYTAVANYECRNCEETTTAEAQVDVLNRVEFCDTTGWAELFIYIGENDSPDGEYHEDFFLFDLPPIGHDWEFVDFTVTPDGDGYTAVANYECRNCEETTTAEAQVDVLSRVEFCDTTGWAELIVYIVDLESPDGEYHEGSVYLELPATGHDWEYVDFSWTETDDGYTAVVNFKCKNDETHTTTADATVTSETTPATYEAAGKIVYTATLEAKDSPDGEDHVETKEVEIPMLIPEWIDVYVIDDNNGEFMNLYLWNGSTQESKTEWPGEAMERLGLDMNGHPYYKMTVDKALYDYLIVNNGSLQTDDLNYVNDLNGREYVIYEIPANFNGLEKPEDIFPDDADHKSETEPTCTEPGVITWTGLLTGATTETEGQPATDHDWEFVDFSWTETDDGYTAVVNFKCKNDETHTTTANATVTSETTPATYEAAGKIVYTATLEAKDSPDGEDHVETKEVEIPMLIPEWIDVYVIDDNDGEFMNLYLWNGDTQESKTEWPGEAMERLGLDMNGHPYYKMTVDKALYDYLIVNNGSLQTDDLNYVNDLNGREYVIYEIPANFNGLEKPEDIFPDDADHKSETEPTCTEPGVITWTGLLTGATTETEGKPATDHDWEFVDFSWTETEDGYTAVANYKCKNNEEHTTTADATVTSETTDPTCEEAGKIVYTATVGTDGPDGEEHSEEKTVTIDALGHDWEYRFFQWNMNTISDDDHEVTQVLVWYRCKNNPDHWNKVEAELISTVTLEPTCTETGVMTYSAHISAEDALDNVERSATSDLVHILPATGHDWEFTGFTWTGNDTDGYTAAVANYKCRNDAEHTDTVQATVTSETTPATTEAEGKIVYTATVTADESLDDEEHTETKEVTLPMIGHFIHVDDYTKGGATTSLVEGKRYDGEVDFTVSADMACLVGILNADGSVTRVEVNNVGDEHHFTVTVTDEDVNLILVYKGDADLNGKIELKDGTRIKRTLVDLMTMTEIEIFAADADGDGIMQSKDATLIARYLVDLDEIPWDKLPQRRRAA